MITEKNATVTETSVAQPRQLPATFLPWIIAAGALIVYLATLNHWVSLNSLPQVARVSGWTWQPELYGPVYWLVTYPFRWLPAKAIPLALNLFSMVCAVLTLALLARSVTLLPHDRTHPQRLREKSEFSLLTVRAAWLPPLLAVIVCGLQLTFWEHATSASGEMLDLLMFAYVIRSLLEFRIDERESWLTRAAFIYGLAMTNNWGMIGFFPLFLTALVWIKGLSFFNLRFLGRMALCGLAGLILYLLLPIVQSRAEIAHVPFWAGLTANIGSQKGILTLLFKNFRPILALLGLTSLLPIFIISIRWASYFGDSSKLGVALATIMFHIVHALFLVACIWVALDPPVSPRNKGAGIPFLTFYYLGALSVGYFIGYFLLVFGTRVDRYRRVPALLSLFSNAVIAAIWILALATPALLLYRNLPQIRATNGGLLRDYTALLTKGVSAQSAVILSDDPRKLMLLRSASTQNATCERYLFLDTTSMKWPDYHRFLRKTYPRRWQSLPAKGRQQVFDNEILDTVIQLAQSNALYYLHPSFGYYFESFYLEPHGLVYKLDPYPTNAVFTPPIGNDLMAENQLFWEQTDTATLKPLQALVSPAGRENQPALMAGFMRRAHLAPETNRTASTLAGFYSRALDYWGVTMQKAGHWPEAAVHFQRALELNPDNVVAQVNLECNQNLQAGRKSSIHPSKAIEDAFGKFRNWVDVMAENGPFDEPNFCYAQGRAYPGQPFSPGRASI